MNTRSTKNKKPLTEEELEAVRQKQVAEDQRLRKLAAGIEKDRAELARGLA